MIDLDPPLTLSPDTACFILLKAREFDAKVDEVDPDEASNPSDDRAIDVLEFNPDDVVEDEIAAAVEALNEDEKLDLLALVWIGRGEFDISEWRAAREAARRVDPERLAAYIAQHPTISDDLEEALGQLGVSLDEYLDERARRPISEELELER